MDSAGRANLLGDTGEDHASGWLWGGPATPVDAVLMLYADTEERLAEDSLSLTEALQAAGGRIVHRGKPGATSRPRAGSVRGAGGL